MKNMPKAKNNFKNSGFTLLEVIIVVVVLSILAAIALPRYTESLEKARAAEGVNILGTLLQAQQRYALDNSNDGAGSLAELDVEFLQPKHFLLPQNSVSDTCYNGVPGNPCAQVTRIGGSYNLTITAAGTICCHDFGYAPSCHDARVPTVPCAP